MKQALEPGNYGRARLALSASDPYRRHGHVVLPWSRDESGWGSLRVPIGVVSNGDGPTVLLTGANHGDELEGPIVLQDIFRSIDARAVRGTVIIVPMLNHPAFKAGRRLSPIDGGNMNRAFRMRAEGTMTEQIAYFVESELVERADAVLDIHSGGRSMYFHPFAVSHKLASPADTGRARDALMAFGAPIGLVLEELDNVGMLDSAVESRGKLFLSTELGGGGSTTPSTLAIARRGLRNFLIHTGVLMAQEEAAPTPTRLMTNDASGYVDCPCAGLIEYLVDMGESVRKDQPLARIYATDRIDTEAAVVVATADGLLVGRFHGGLVQAGDFIGLIARDL
jgi:N-alpha-acetyl-L-2,4-diaminobutyrate deacetylase